MRAREFKAARARLGLSQYQIAHALGMHRSAIAKYEAGDLKVPTVVALAVECLERRQQEARKAG